MRNKQKGLNITAGVLAALLIAVVLWGLTYRASPLRVRVSDGIEPVGLDTIFLRWKPASPMPSSPAKTKPGS